MNKDQKLLEEAYQSIYESAREPEYFGPPERKQNLLRQLHMMSGMVEVHEDGSVSVHGEVDFTHHQIFQLPFKFKEVTGKFICMGNYLKSLEGAPEKVGGGFTCSSNQLSSLKGSPEVIEQYFDCSNNKITSLEGAPRIVKGDFWCRYNPNLTSLEGAPEFIGGVFDSKQFSDEDYRKFVKKRELDKRVSKELDKDFDVNVLNDFE
jgi:hypothetical protein